LIDTIFFEEPRGNEIMASLRKHNSIRKTGLALLVGLLVSLCLGAAVPLPALASQNITHPRLAHQTISAQAVRRSEAVAVSNELAASPSGQISGMVTASDTHLPLKNVLVLVYDTSGLLMYHQGSTDENGVYSITSLAAGNYKLFFRFYSGEHTIYAPEWYEDQHDQDNANLVAVKNGQTTSGIDDSLNVGGQITGVVTALDGGAPLGNAYVEAYGEYDTICPPASLCSPRVFTYTNSIGEYTLTGLETGNYRVGFGAHDYLFLTYDNKTTWENADFVSVTLGQTTDNINGALTFGGSISGHITDADGGAPLEGAYVYAFDSPTAAEVCYDCPSYVSFDQTDASGAYSLDGLATGDYYVKFGKQDYLTSYYDGHSRLLDGDPISVTATQITSNIDAALILGGKISGHVTSTKDNSPLDEVDVYVYDAPDSAIENYMQIRRTNSNGLYTVNELPAGDYYLRFVKNGYREVYYDNQSILSQANAVTVGLSQITENIDASLDQMGIITGRVTDAASGEPVAGVEVAVYDISYIPPLNPKDYGMTDEDGIFMIDGLEPGNYYLKFSKPGYLPIYYDQKQSLSEADSVGAAINSITGQIDAVLSPGGTISGNVTDAQSGDPLENAGVCLYTDPNAEPCEVGDWYIFGNGAIDGIFTDAEGHYSFESLPTGTYYVEFVRYGERPLFYSGWLSLKLADPINIIAGQRINNINGTLNFIYLYFPLIHR
jgi:5-hydroxyisourate hydrolase-like protein (transthyretin family)